MRNITENFNCIPQFYYTKFNKIKYIIIYPENCSIQIALVKTFNSNRLLNVYRKIFGTSSYGEDALAECISAI